jgi:peptidoglycan/LPS O-acetylase OafA/YrhL
VNGWHPTSITSVVPGGWSIAVEMTFYLFVPFLYGLIKRLHTALWATIMVLFGSVSLQFIAAKWIASICPPRYLYLVEPFTFFWFPTQAPIFFVGIVLYFLLSRYLADLSRGDPSSLGQLSPLFLVISVYLFLALAFGGFSLIPLHFLYGISFALFSYSLAAYPYPLFVNRPICYVGKISFSTYVWHFVPIRAMSKKVPIMLDSMMSPGICFLILFFITLFSTLLIASLSFHLIEVPGMKLGRIFLKRANEIRFKGGPECQSSS